MKALRMLSRTLLAASLLASGAAYADALTLSDPAQLGRLSRNSVAQDWSHFELDPTQNGEQYPGAINPGVSYRYHTYFYNVGSNPFIQIDIDSMSSFTFFSAYQTFYNPLNKQQQWLGDAGQSGNYAFDANPADAVDPRYFQVVAALNSTLVIVVNETSGTTSGASTGIGAPFTLAVESYPDSQYNFDPVFLSPVSAAARIPEPSTLLLLAPLALVAGLKTRRRRATRQPSHAS